MALEKIIKKKIVNEYQPRNLSLFVSLGQTHDVRKSYLQERFFRKVQNYSYKVDNDLLGDFDVGILRLETPFVLGNETNIYPACLLSGTRFLSKGVRLLQGDSLVRNSNAEC